jgi:hypothetical protein
MDAEAAKLANNLDIMHIPRALGVNQNANVGPVGTDSRQAQGGGDVDIGWKAAA